MPIRAKRVDSRRAAEFARGQISILNRPKQNTDDSLSFHGFDKVPNQAHTFKHGGNDSDSDTGTTTTSMEASEATESSSSTDTASLHRERTIKQLKADDKEELVLTAAREHARRLLYPKSERNASKCSKLPTASQPNERLLIYQRTKAAKERTRKCSEEVFLTSMAQQGNGPTEASASLNKCDVPESKSSINDQTGDANALSCLANVDDGEMNSKVCLSTPKSFSNPETAEKIHFDPLHEEFAALLELLSKETPTTAKRSTPTPLQELLPVTSWDCVEEVVREKYPTPPRTFAELEQRTLDEMYRIWTNQSQDREAGLGAIFVATDHSGEALALAKAACLNMRSPPLQEGIAATRLTHFMDEPLTLEEMAIDPSARRNPALCVPYPKLAQKGCPSVTLATFAQQAQERLNRFWLSVRWAERLVSDVSFIYWLAEFLYEHHKIFLKYLSQGSSAPSVLDKIEDHDHEEYTVYEKFGNHVSSLLLQVLTRHVPDFDEGEFVEGLYDFPVNLGLADCEGSEKNAFELHGIFSYQTWRIILALSDFKSFFVWMIDYITEEYEMAITDKSVVAVGGARGLRALLRSTYRFQKNTNAPSPQTILPSSHTAATNRETSLIPPPSHTNAVLPRKSSEYASNKLTQEASSGISLVCDKELTTSTPIHILDSLRSVPAAIPLDSTMGCSKLLTPSPPAGACTRRFFLPTKASRPRAVRNLPRLEASDFVKTNSENRPVTDIKRELAGSYPDVTRPHVSTNKSRNALKSTNEILTNAMVSTRNTSTHKNAPRSASSRKPQLPTSGVKPKLIRRL